MLLTLRKLLVIGLSFVHIINSNMRDIHTERSDNFCCLHFLFVFSTNRFKDGGLFTNGIMGEQYLINIVEKENPAN
jgi:hypothetical protein